MPLLLDPTAPPRTLGSLVWSELRLGIVLCVAVAGFLSLVFDVVQLEKADRLAERAATGAGEERSVVVA